MRLFSAGKRVRVTDSFVDPLHTGQDLIVSPRLAVKHFWPVAPVGHTPKLALRQSLFLHAYKYQAFKQPYLRREVRPGLFVRTPRNATLHLTRRPGGPTMGGAEMTVFLGCDLCSALWGAYSQTQNGEAQKSQVLAQHPPTHPARNRS